MLLAWRKRRRGTPCVYRTGPSQGTTDLNYDQHRAIRWKDEYTLWRREDLPFQVRFFTVHLRSADRNFMRWRTARLNGFDIHRTF
jgi:hypothetical protein